MMFSSPVAEMSSSTIRPLTRCSRLMYSSSSMLGQKLTSWMQLVGRADAVDAPEPLNDADRVPVDVVIDQVVAVLQVLAFGDAIRGDQQIQLSLARPCRRAFLGARRKSGQDAGKIAAKARQVGLIPPAPVTSAACSAESLQRPRRQLARRGTGPCRRRP